ncbi:MAG: glycosyltransferase family A protein [Parvibaculum sp.]
MADLKLKASVVIPVKNPGRQFHNVISMVMAQSAPWPFEVLVIDSGSTDGTLEYLATVPQVRVERISPSEFGHGKTRNLGVSLTHGEFIAFLTHDAQPADDRWLANMVHAVEQDSGIAGAFGRHLAYPGASAFTRRDLTAHFEGFLQFPAVLERETDAARYASDPGWRQVVRFYSDNNSCMRRSVWQNIPYPEVEFAEDQIWAMRIVEAGYKKAYAANAVVYHSHDYGIAERLRRSFDEANAFRELFGDRLCVSLRGWAKSIWGLARRDLAFGRECGLPLKARWAQVGQIVALVTGHYLGTHADTMPPRLKRALSQDKRLLHSLDRPERWSLEPMGKV